MSSRARIYGAIGVLYFVVLVVSLSTVAASGLLLAGSLVTARGYPVSGRIGVLSYELILWGARVDAPLLDSLRVLGLLHAALSLLLLVLIVAGLRGPDSLESKVVYGVCMGSGSAIVSAFSHSIARVVYDYASSLPLGGVIQTSAGNLILPGSTIYWGPAMKLYLHGFYLAAALLGLLAATALGLAYYYGEASRLGGG